LSAAVSIHIARWAVTGFVALVGLLAGSFLNVVIYRVPRGLSVAKPRSFCPHCDTPVRPIDNVPVVSWVMLGGRCHHCRGPISARYPLVESATAVVFAAVGWGLGPHWAVAGFCVLAASLIALVAIEADGLPPPLSVAGIGTGLGAALLLGAGVADRRWSHVVGLIVGLVVAVALVVIKSPWTSSAPVLLPVGAVLGWLGLASTAEGLATAAAVLVIDRLARGRQVSPDPDRVVISVALASGAVVASVVAVAIGAGVGR
jgi:leader peptidase (prepilin peptidase)/N-methyltransferase